MAVQSRKYLCLVVIWSLLAVTLRLFYPSPAVGMEAPVIQGKAAVLMDLGTGRILYAKNQHQRMPPASLTKIMTALLVVEDGHLQKKVRVSRKASETGESTLQLRPGETLTRLQLLYGLMLISANDAAVALSESVASSEDAFVRKMNRRAGELHLRDTHFCNPHGLEAEGHYSSAYDLAVITRKAMADPVFEEVVATKTKTLPWAGQPWDRYLWNKNRLLYRYPGAIGVKTGYTREAGNCVVGAAQRGNLKLIAISLNSPQVYDDLIKLLDYGFSQYQGKTIPVPEERLQIAVKQGVIDKIQLQPKHRPVVALRPGETGHLSYRVVEPDSITAPVKKNERLGTLKIYLKGRQIGSIDLLASQSVARRPSRWERLVTFLLGLLHRLLG